MRRQAESCRGQVCRNNRLQIVLLMSAIGGNRPQGVTIRNRGPVLEKHAAHGENAVNDGARQGATVVNHHP